MQSELIRKGIKMFAWSKIDEVDTLFFVAMHQMHLNECDYHNLDHIAAMYKHLHDTNEPYDKALDWAILYHDVVYDELPDKEERSAKYFAEHALRSMSTDFVSQVEELIMATKLHIVEKPHWSPIIRADLHALANHETARKNAELIKAESMKLYGVPEQEWAKATVEFMQGLCKRVHDNAEKHDRKHREFYLKVYDGCIETIKLAKKSC
jgi:predicted metal-dependent HD superfamily phosphohydrolase